MPRPILEIKEPYTPEMIGTAAAAIEAFLLTTPGPTALEFGGGYSTVWLAGMCKRVVWVEHDPDWHEETERALREAQRVSKAKAVLVTDENEIGATVDGYGLFDLILVDCLDRQRTAAVEHAIDHLAPGGLFVLDDSQWDMLSEAKKLLDSQGWESATYSGSHTRKNGRVRHHETTIYLKPDEDEEE
jgi:predicted O-methyltransferase YrrM